MKKKKEITAEEMLVRMAGLCAGAEQCSADIRSKILLNGFSAETADCMISYLQRNSYIDDSRYARAFAADKVKFAGWGRLKVRMALHVKGISDADIVRALGYIREEDYRGAMEKALTAKARSLDLTDVKDRQKLYRHLASRGFESSLIIASIRKFMSQNNNPE